MKMPDRYSRQTMLPQIGEEGQKRLTAATVLIVGVGGLGSAVSTYLAGAGIGRLILADPDAVSLSNLQRQVLYSECEIGLPKTVCAARRLRSINSEVEIEICQEGITADNAQSLVSQCDLVIDCTDNYATRYLIDDACHQAAKPWIYGTIGEFDGQVGLFTPLSGLRYSDLYEERKALCSMPPRTAGVLGAVPGVVGAVQACQAVKYIAGFGDTLEGRLWTIDLITLQSTIINI